MAVQKSRDTGGGTGELHIVVGQQDADEVLGRVVGPHRAEAAVPPVAARRQGRAACRRRCTPRPRPQPERAVGVGTAAATWAGVSWLVVMASTVGRDSRRRPRCSPPASSISAKACQVVDRGDEAGAAAGEGRGRGPLAVGRVVDRSARRSRGRAVARPRSGGARPPARRRRCRPCPAGSRIRSASTSLERLARGSGDQHARGCRRSCGTATARPAGGPAAPSRRRRIHSSGAGGCCGAGGPAPRPRARPGPSMTGCGPGRGEVPAEAGPEGQQVAQGDRPLGRAPCRRAGRRGRPGPGGRPARAAGRRPGRRGAAGTPRPA